MATKKKQEQLAKSLKKLSDNKDFFAKAGYKWDDKKSNVDVWTTAEDSFYKDLPLSEGYGSWVHPRFRKWLDKNKLAFEFYDGGTLHIFEEN